MNRNVTLAGKGCLVHGSAPTHGKIGALLFDAWVQVGVRERHLAQRAVATLVPCTSELPPTHRCRRFQDQRPPGDSVILPARIEDF
jgi:hypothetical protein